MSNITLETCRQEDLLELGRGRDIINISIAMSPHLFENILVIFATKMHKPFKPASAAKPAALSAWHNRWPIETRAVPRVCHPFKYAPPITPCLRRRCIRVCSASAPDRVAASHWQGREDGWNALADGNGETFWHECRPDLRIALVSGRLGCVRRFAPAPLTTL